MIIRTRRKNESLIGRILGSVPPCSDPSDFLDEEQFQRELLKEIYRSDRRAVDREIGLIRVIFQGQDQSHIEIDDGILEAFRTRLRVADSIGWYDSSLAVLLPETDKEGTLQVANSIAAIASQSNLLVETEVSVYPWDDELVVLSDELRELAGNKNHDSDGPDNDGGHNGQRHDGSTRPSNANGATKSSPSPASGKPVQCQRSAENVLLSRHSFVRPIPTPWWKRTVDIVGSSIGLLILSPVFLIVAIAIKLTSRGPVFFRQMREGKNGKSFGILKFRTMDVDAEERQSDLRQHNEQDGPAFKLTNDPRVTPIGKFLRRSCVDELPQLVNVLMGDMSLVGPRPLPVGESYACHAWQRARLTVLPGLTCTWQVRGGRDVTFAQWMRMDLEYIQRRSFWFDLKLIFESAFVALMHRGSV